MKNTDPLERIDPLDLLLLIVWLAVEAARLLLLPLIALVLTLVVGHAPPTPQPVTTDTAPEAPRSPCNAPWLPPALPHLDDLPVAQLRRLARAQGLPRCLSASGRRADLLMALPLAW